MIQAAYKDKPLVIDILTKAFDSNKSVNYVVKQDSKREKRIRTLMDYSFEASWAAGEIYLTQDKKAVVLLLLPHTKKTSIKSIFQDLNLALTAIGITRVPKVLKLESSIKKHYPKCLMYISFIGVIPELQRTGIGSSLLKDIIQLSIKRKIPIYLETSRIENISFYEKHNFEIYNKIEPEHVIYMFKRDAI
jgi:ribosomal protein S18 acetylase RimI-like enzyme